MFIMPRGFGNRKVVSVTDRTGSEVGAIRKFVVTSRWDAKRGIPLQHYSFIPNESGIAQGLKPKQDSHLRTIREYLHRK